MTFLEFFFSKATAQDQSQTMKPRFPREMFRSLLVFSFSYCLAVSTLTVTTERRAAGNDVRVPPGSAGAAAASAGKRSATLALLTGRKPPLPVPPAGPRAAPKEAEVVEDVEEVAELPPKPLPQTMLPRNMTADALKPPLGAAQVAPPPRQIVDVDVCRYGQQFLQGFLC